MSEEIKIDFQFNEANTEVSLSTSEYLIDRANTSELKDYIQIIVAGNNLKVKEANQLLKAVFRAIIINGGAGDEIINEILDKEDRAEKIEVAIPGSSKGKSVDKNVINGKSLEINGKIPKKIDPKDICHFFATNKCKFGKDCRREHPKICNKFKKFGLIKFNNKNGCTEDCAY